MSKQTSVELPNMSPEDNLGNHAVVKHKKGRPSKVRMSTNGDAITLGELQKGGVGSFTIKPPVTIASVGRRRFGYRSCMVCRKKTNQNTEGKYVCVQHPDADTKARYCLRVQLKQDNISMWSIAFHGVAEIILAIYVEDFEALNDDGRKTVVWPVIGMKCNMTIGKTVGEMYTNYTVESVKFAGYLP